MANFYADAEQAGITVTESGLLLDVSDTTEWGHNSATRRILVKSLKIHGELITAGAWTIRVGTLSQVSSTVGDVGWWAILPIDAAGKFSEAWVFGKDEGSDKGLSTGFLGSQDTRGQLLMISTNAWDADSTQWQTDTTLDNRAAMGAAVAPAAGDLVWEAVEDTDGGTISYVISLEYSQP